MKKGINREIILKESESVLKRRGFDNLSLREIAAALGVKPSSLYNHITGVGEIHEYLAITASARLKESLEKAMAGKSRDDAFLAGGKAYRRFADNNRELYKVLIRSRSSKDTAVKKCSAESFAPLRTVIKSYGGTKEQNVHFIRAFRSFMHGFTEIAHNGFMQKGVAPKEQTYDLVLRKFLEILRGFGDNA